METYRMIAQRIVTAMQEVEEGGVVVIEAQRMLLLNKSELIEHVSKTHVDGGYTFALDDFRYVYNVNYTSNNLALIPITVMKIISDV